MLCSKDSDASCYLLDVAYGHNAPAMINHNGIAMNKGAWGIIPSSDPSRALRENGLDKALRFGKGCKRAHGRGEDAATQGHLGVDLQDGQGGAACRLSRLEDGPSVSQCA